MTQFLSQLKSHVLNSEFRKTRKKVFIHIERYIEPCKITIVQKKIFVLNKWRDDCQCLCFVLSTRSSGTVYGWVTQWVLTWNSTAWTKNFFGGWNGLDCVRFNKCFPFSRSSFRYNLRKHSVMYKFVSEETTRWRHLLTVWWVIGNSIFTPEPFEK